MSSLFDVDLIAELELRCEENTRKSRECGRVRAWLEYARLQAELGAGSAELRAMLDHCDGGAQWPPYVRARR